MNKWRLVEWQIKFHKFNVIIICSIPENVDTIFKLDVVVEIKDHAISVIDLTIIVRTIYVKKIIADYIGTFNKIVGTI